jgi:hypothetical protein
VKDVYLAASWNRREEMRMYRRQLERYNIRVTSRWLDTDHLDSFDGDKGKVGATVDVQDIMRADTLILFSGNSTTGGLHVELGIAIGLGIATVVIGEVENIFQLLAGNHFDNWSEFEEGLAKMRSEEVYPHGSRHS